MVDAVLAMIGDAFRLRFTDTGDQRFFIAPEKIVLPEDLLRFRHRGGLPGHAEFGARHVPQVQYGSIGSRFTSLVGEALALKKLVYRSSKFLPLKVKEPTAGGSHEAKNGAWAMVLATFTGWWTGTILALMIEEHLQWSLVGLMNGLLSWLESIRYLRRPRLEQHMEGLCGRLGSS